MKKWQFMGTTVLGTSLLLGACGGGANGDSSDLKGEAKGDGSSTVAPIVEKLNEKWAQEHSDAQISAGNAGTGAGFQKFISGDIDFADASRPIKDEEKQKLKDKNIKYHEFKIAQDGVTVAVNKDNDFVKELDKKQLKEIYSGKAKTWKDVNSSWPDKKINAVSPNSSHGTYDFFEEEVMDKQDIKAEKNADTNAIVSSVTKNKEGIGYFGYNFYEQNKDKLKEVKIKDDNGKVTEPTKKTIQNNSYALSRPLFMYVKDDAMKKNDVMSEFIKFVLKDEGKSAEDAGYVASPKDTYKKQLEDVNKFLDDNKDSKDDKDK